MTIHYVRPDGTYVGGYSEESNGIPEAKPTQKDAYPSFTDKLFCIGHECPEYSDQVWQFPGWSESIGKKIRAEIVWRSSEMQLIDSQLQRIADSDPTAMPGTEQQWREYRVKVRAWSDGFEGYPDSEKRPTRPEPKK